MPGNGLHAEMKMYKQKYLSCLDSDKYVSVADKVANNIGCVCKSHHIDDKLINEFGILILLWNSAYNLSRPAKKEILDTHKSVLFSFVISTKDEGLDRPSL